MALVVKNPPAKEGDLGDAGLTPGSGRSMATRSRILAWRIPVANLSLAGYRPRGRKDSD